MEFIGQFVTGTITSYFSGREMLEELQEKMEIIKARLSDAQKLQEGEEGDQTRLKCSKKGLHG